MANDIVVKPEVEKGLKELTKYADELVVNTPEDAEDAGIKLYQISELKKTVEDQRTEITKPLNLSLRSINAFFKKFSVPLETVDDQIRAKVALFGKETDQVAFGVIHLRKNQVIEVIDQSKVPAKYLIVDMAKVKADVKEGIEIPGIKVSEEKTVSL